MNAVAKKSFYFLFKNAISALDCGVECFSVDESLNDDTEFDIDEFLFSVNYNYASVGLTVNFETEKWYISADSGYYQIGKSYDLHDSEIIEVLNNLLKTIL